MVLQPVVLCGPSGSGKSTLLKRLMKEFPEVFGFSVSHTTRNPRPNEIDGVDYHFVTKEKFESMISEEKFIETAVYAGNCYGTSVAAVKDILISGKICVLDIDMAGVQQVKKSDLNPKYIFIRAPSLKVLENRIRGRGTEKEENISRRLLIAEKELEFGAVPGNFDNIVVNDQLEAAYSQLREFLYEDAMIASR